MLWGISWWKTSSICIHHVIVTDLFQWIFVLLMMLLYNTISFWETFGATDRKTNSEIRSPQENFDEDGFHLERVTIHHALINLISSLYGHNYFANYKVEPIEGKAVVQVLGILPYYKTLKLRFIVWLHLFFDLSSYLYFWETMLGDFKALCRSIKTNKHLRTSKSRQA